MLPTPNKITFPQPIEAMLARLSATQLDETLAAEAATLIVELATKLNPDPLDVNLDLNTVSRRGVVVKLSPNQTAAVYQLSQSYPRLVPLAELSKAVWGVRHPRSTNTIRVMMTETRLKLALLNATIENKHGRGYCLELGVA